MSVTSLPSRRSLAATAALAALSASGYLLTAAPAHANTRFDNVIVSGQSGALASVEYAVRAAGGSIHRVLGVVDGVAASVPAGSVPQLRLEPGVRAVTPDAVGHLLGIDPALGYDVTNDEGSLYDVGQITHATSVWNKYDGQGVDVALVDSGVAPVRGLTSGNVLNGPDLSFESQTPNLANLDTYGHGTHMASIIVGRDVPGAGNDYANANSHNFHGIAPDARLISIKVAANSGAVDVSQVIAGIDWVVSHANDPGFNIRVLNLSYGTQSTQDPSVDPLDYAVENAWRAGIVVVVAGGNDGTNRAALADPANDPLVLAVGADDPNYSDSISDDTVPAFSQHGTTARHVDIIAPGVHILGLRDPGSFIDQGNPQAVVNGRFFRGSGTSQAAAVVSGLSALYLSKYPNATPDQVKRALMMTATSPNAVKQQYAGLGVPDINKAMGQRPNYTQPATGATGNGSLEAARGGNHVNDGVADLTGEQDIFGHAWDGNAWALASASGNAWTGGVWNGNAWTGNAWTGNTWTGNAWTGNTWTGNAWTGNAWTGNAWTGNAWTGNAWTGNAWTGNAWTGNAWSGNAWSDATWN
jgi:serine protease AprX